MEVGTVLFDWTLHMSDLVIFGGGVLAFLKVFLTVRDSLRDLTKAVGATDPPSGLVGDMKHVKREQRQHREWLIRAGLDQANHDGTRYEGER